jgi:hypothetical protein
MLTVHVRVTDAATGKPTPVRLRIADASGAYHAPLGRLARFATEIGEDVGGQVEVGGRSWAYIDGVCEVSLPPGLLTVEICKGVEYRPIRREVNLAPGQISLRFAIERRADLPAEGWYAGDLRAHELSPHAALLEGAAEGLAVVQLLARKVPELLAFSGTKAALSSAACHVVVNTMNSHPVLGTVGLLHSHRPVFPLRFGAPGASDDWSVADWCDQCHRKAGFVTWPDLPRLDEAHPQGEALSALVLGKVNAYEICSIPAQDCPAIRDYYRLLNAGLSPVLVGGSGKESNAVPLGALRTYARLSPGEPLTAESWITSVSSGRTFITNGPLLSLRVNATAGPGDRVGVRPGERVQFRAEARSVIPFDRLELVAGGDVIAEASASGDRVAATIETDYLATKSTWIALRCYSVEHLDTGSYVYAHANPLWLDVAGRPFVPAEEALAFLFDNLARTRRWVEAEARCADKARQHLLGVLDEARQVLQSRRGP